MRTFALEDRLVAIETAIASLHAVLVPGDKGQAVSNANAERKVCSLLCAIACLCSRQTVCCQWLLLCKTVRLFAQYMQQVIRSGVQELLLKY